MFCDSQIRKTKQKCFIRPFFFSFSFHLLLVWSLDNIVCVVMIRHDPTWLCPRRPRLYGEKWIGKSFMDRRRHHEVSGTAQLYFPQAKILMDGSDLAIQSEISFIWSFVYYFFAVTNGICLERSLRNSISPESPNSPIKVFRTPDNCNIFILWIS